LAKLEVIGNSQMQCVRCKSLLHYHTSGTP